MLKMMLCISFDGTKPIYMTAICLLVTIWLPLVLIMLISFKAVLLTVLAVNCS